MFKFNSYATDFSFEYAQMNPRGRRMTIMNTFELNDPF